MKGKRSPVHRTLRRLAKLVRLRFVAGMSTGEIMRQMKSGADRKTLVAVACLDLKDQEFEAAIASEDPALRSDLWVLRRSAYYILKLAA